MKVRELFETSVSAEKISLDDVKDHKHLAQKLGVSVTRLKGLSDEEIKTILQHVGYHDFSPKHDFDPKELSLGIEVEKEHTKSALVAELIARDHLKELPDYYSRLEKMEKEAHDHPS